MTKFSVLFDIIRVQLLSFIANLELENNHGCKNREQ
jgi:hypothetical protein